MSTNAASADVKVDATAEWANFERLPVPARDILRNAYGNFPSQEVAFLLSRGYTTAQIDALIAQHLARDCLQTYGPSHPQASGSHSCAS